MRGTVELPLTLESDKKPMLRWWVDRSHAVHPNLRGHSSGCLSLGKGMLISGSTKQKINTQSSTETELVAADNYMSLLLWTNSFLESQGLDSNGAVLLQDNQSAILLEKMDASLVVDIQNISTFVTISSRTGSQMET